MFFWFLQQQKNICEKNKDRKSFTELGKCFKCLLSMTVLPRAVLEPNKKPMVDVFCKNS